MRGTEIAEYPAHGFSMVVIPGYLYQDILSLGDWVGEKAQGFKTCVELSGPGKIN